jgi:hypothetical protein
LAGRFLGLVRVTHCRQTTQPKKYTIHRTLISSQLVLAVTTKREGPTMGFIVVTRMQRYASLLLVLLQQAVQGFYLPGVNPQAFAEDES